MPTFSPVRFLPHSLGAVAIALTFAACHANSGAPTTASPDPELAALHEQVAQVDRRIEALARHSQAHQFDDATAPAAATPLATLRRTIARCEQQRDMHLLNLAHVQTPGYQRRIARVDSSAAEPVLHIDVDTTRGAVRATGRDLDLAIDGDGYLIATAVDGLTVYTRAGNLRVGGDGRLLVANGAAVWPPIIVPADAFEVAVDANGNVTARTASEPALHTPLGRLALALPTAGNPLVPFAAGLSISPPSAPQPTRGNPGEPGFGRLRGRHLEGSNVDLAAERQALAQLEAELAQLASPAADTSR